MMLFGERSLKNLQSFLEGKAHGTFILRNGGFHSKEVDFLSATFLGKDSANLLSLRPLEGKKTVAVEQIRSLMGSLGLGAKSGGERRLVVINSRLGVQAQNALLKVLEEPPKGIFFLILASEEDDYLPTIQSRCQVIKLSGPSEEEALSFAVESGISESEAKVLWLQSGGSASELMSLIENSEAREKSLDYLADAKSFLKENDYGKLAVMKKYLANKDDATEFIKGILVVIELISKKGAREALSFADLAKRSELALKNLSLNANLRMELLGLVV
jgi:DNA polymerase III subunit delta'